MNIDKQIKKCIEPDCEKLISRGSKLGRCHSCEMKRRHREGISGKGNFIDGRSLKKYFCIEKDCGNEISYNAANFGLGRCSSCSHIGKLHPLFGKHHTEETKIKMRKVNLSKEFLEKEYIKNIKAPVKIAKENNCSISTVYRLLHDWDIPVRSISEARKLIRDSISGENSFMFGKKLSQKTKDKIGVASLKRWKNIVFVNKIKIARNLSPNKTEMRLLDILQRILPNEYKYVGNFEVVLDGKCPDFINCNGQKKLIELFGDYWHKKSEVKSRTNHFKKYGYKTLIIWERELKNLTKLNIKILNFNEK